MLDGMKLYDLGQPGSNNELVGRKISPSFMLLKASSMVPTHLKLSPDPYLIVLTRMGTKCLIGEPRPHSSCLESHDLNTDPLSSFIPLGNAILLSFRLV